MCRDGFCSQGICFFTARLIYRYVSFVFLNRALQCDSRLFVPQESSIAGVIILERCKVDTDSDGGNRYAFKLGE